MNPAPDPRPPAKSGTAAGRARDADAEVLAVARRRLAASLDADDVNRRNYVADTLFSSTEDQWDAGVKALRGKNRPALTFNRLNGVIKQIIGDYRQNKLSIKVLPASGEASEETADVLAGIIRNVEAASNADVAYANALECAARGGFGYFRVLTEYAGDDAFEQDLVIRPVHNPLTVHFDPAARLITRADAGWCFVTEMVPRDEFERRHPGVPAASFDGLDDADRWRHADDVRVAEYYEKVKYPARLAALSNGMVAEVDDEKVEALAAVGVAVEREREAERTKVVWRRLCASRVLETREYKAKYIPVVPVIGEEVNVEGRVLTRSAIFYAKDAQRMYNYWKTTATEAVALAPKAKWVLTPEMVRGFEDDWAEANTSPTPYLLFNADGGGPPQQVPPAVPPAAELALGNNAADDIKATNGIYDASLGARSNETSGRAIVARQQEGANATFLFIDNLTQAIEHGGRVLIDYIPTVFDTERVVRLLDPEGNPQTEVVNRRERDPLTGVTRVLNAVTVGKYDVVVTAGPSFANRKAEAVAGMSQLVGAYPPIMQVAGDLLVKNLDWPGAEEIAERLKRSLPPNLTADDDSPEAQAAMQQQQAVQQQVQQQQMALAERQVQAETAKARATVAKAEADIVKAKAETAQALAGASGESEPSQASPSRPRQQPPVSIQFNAEHALAGVGEAVTGMARQQAASTQQTLELIRQLLAANARTNQTIAATLEAERQEGAQQSAAMTAVTQQAAAGNLAVADAVRQLAAVMAAPRVAVRDKAGNIVASEVRV